MKDAHPKLPLGSEVKNQTDFWLVNQLYRKQERPEEALKKLKKNRQKGQPLAVLAAVGQAAFFHAVSILFLLAHRSRQGILLSLVFVVNREKV